MIWLCRVPNMRFLPKVSCPKTRINFVGPLIRRYFMSCRALAEIGDVQLSAVFATFRISFSSIASRLRLLSPNRNTSMHPDRKIGFAMGILLIGIVGALFFRNEPLMVDHVPAVRREKVLNEQLRTREIAVYLEDDIGSESRLTPERGEQPEWTLSELVRDLDARNDDVPLPVGVSQRTVRKDGGHAAPLDDFRAAVPDGLFAGEADAGSELDPVPQIVGQSERQTAASGKPETAGTSATDDEPEFDEYTVEYGDTLSKIAERHLGSPSRFQEIYEANRDRMATPDRLRVGESLRIPRH